MSQADAWADLADRFVTGHYGTVRGRVRTFVYDADGVQTFFTRPDGNLTGANAGNYTTITAYNSNGRQTSVTAGDGTGHTVTPRQTQYGYDANGNQTTVQDARDHTTTTTYNADDQATLVTDPDGNKTSMSDATGSPSYVYDPFGELTSATTGAGQVTSYRYLADGQVSSITYPLPSGAIWATSDTVNYAYDHADQMLSATDFNGNWISMANTADGLPSSLTLGSTGDLIDATYDNADMPSLIKLKNSTSTLQSFTYTDGPADTILNESDTPTSSLAPAVYTYDPQRRVASMTPGSGSTLNYGFDASSNLTTLPGGAAGGYDHAGELTSAVLGGTTTTYSYNADGQQLSAVQGSTVMASGSWDGAGDLTAYSDPAANMNAAVYDGNGLRATATTGSGTQDFVRNSVPSVSPTIDGLRQCLHIRRQQDAR